MLNAKGTCGKGGGTMATTFVIACPECERQVKVSEDLVGKKIRCKGCEHVFAVKAPAGSAAKAPPPAPKPKAGPPPLKPEAAPKEETKPAPAPEIAVKKPYDDDDDGGPANYGVTAEESDLPRCPFCAKEMATETAVICMNCGYNTRTRLRPEVKKVHAHTGGDIFKHLLPGILCVIAILSMIVWDLIFCMKIEGWIKADLYDEKDGWVAGMNPGFFKTMMSALMVFLSFLLARIAYKRLVVNNKPKEKQLEKEEK